MDLAKESVNYCRNTRITAYLRRFRPISGGSQLTQSWSKKANFRFLGDHWSVLLQSTGALNSSQADLQLKRADNSASWWPKKERDCAIQTAWLSACSLFFFVPPSQIFLPLTPENFGRKSRTSANSKKISSIGTRKKKVSIAHAEPLSTSRQFSYLKRNSMPNICHVAILIFGRKCTGLIWYFLRKF